jgi:hypothetical protein
MVQRLPTQATVTSENRRPWASRYFRRDAEHGGNRLVRRHAFRAYDQKQRACLML